MTELLLALLNGLASGSVVFLVAAGLTLIFGVGGVLNFAHGGVFAVGAYVMYTMLNLLGASWGSFLVSAGVAIVLCGICGALIELFVVRRLYALPHEQILLATYAILLVLDGLIEAIWGIQARSSTAPGGLRATIDVGGVRTSVFSIVIIVLALVVLGALHWWLRRTQFGHVAKAAAHDAEASQALGISVPVVMTGVFVVGSMLAGLAGAVLAPNQALVPQLGTMFIVQAFAAVVLGGLGSVSGAWIAALVLGIADSLWFTYLESVPQIGVFVVLAAILVVRPAGIMGVKA